MLTPGLQVFERRFSRRLEALMTGRQLKKFAHINGRKLAYVDLGRGDPLVFLHGNPTSSYLWRNIIAPLSSGHRCIAPDLIGMGDSDKLEASGPASYSFFEHRSYLESFLDSLALERKVTLVVHDWGSALGFDWAARHPDRVQGIAYMEAIVGVLTWELFRPAARALFEGLRSEAGETLVLRDNVFVEQILPLGVSRTLGAEEMNEYRRPFLEPGESRRPTLSWPRQLPIEGSPREVVEVVERYARFMETTALPKLFVNAEPGVILVGALREACRRWPNQREVTVSGLHYVQEDSSADIAAALEEWSSSLP
jgi:haloalkane dehalogenase